MLKLLALIEEMSFIILYDKHKKLISSILAMLVILIASCISIINTAEGQPISSSKMTLPSSSSTQKKDIVIGAWAPSNFHLEKMQDPKHVNQAILSLLGQGFGEYYFAMRDFNNASEVKATEQLLKSADTTNLKIIIILLPPSESGNYGAYSNANYDWKGWIVYFNSLKKIHPSSFLGFAIDDFNAVDGIRRLYVMNNMYFMASSKLSTALHNKRKDIQFYPVMYLETGGFETLKNNYDKFLSGIILVNTSPMSSLSSYYNLTQIDDNMRALSKMFENKPLKYILYPTNAQNYSLSDRRHLTDSLLIASRLFDSIIIYVRIDNSIIQDFLHNLHYHQYHNPY
jgi:hypothetical protein